MNQITCYDAFVRSPIDHGVDTFFGLPGAQTYVFFESHGKHRDLSQFCDENVYNPALENPAFVKPAEGFEVSANRSCSDAELKTLLKRAHVGSEQAPVVVGPL